MLRVWGGGMFLPEAFYDACDQMGLLVYHDMQYAQQGHSPKATRAQDAELRHNIRRLASHPATTREPSSSRPGDRVPGAPPA